MNKKHTFLQPIQANGKQPFNQHSKSLASLTPHNILSTFSEMENTHSLFNQSNYSTKYNTKLSFKDSLILLPGINSSMHTTTNFKFKYQKLEQKQITDQPDEKDFEYEKDLISNLQQSFEDEQYDQVPQLMVGPRAIEHYHRNYKKLSRIKEQNKFGFIKDSPQTLMLSKCESLSLLPCRIGVVKNKGDEGVLKLQNQNWGDKYISVVSEALQHQNIKDLNFSSNRIQPRGANELLPVASKKGKTIDISKNHIGRLGCEAIVNVILSKESKIERLNLEDNGLGDRVVVNLLAGLQQHPLLKILNISKNCLTSACCEEASKLLKVNYNLKELYLSWNQINSSGGAQLFEALQSSENLLVLDVSYNCLGSSNGKVVERLSEFFQKNRSLIHLDLTSNHFNLAQCRIISEAIKLNHSIYGLHFMGNSGYVDSKGFICLDDQLEDNFREIHVQKKINGLQPLQTLGKNTSRDTRVKDVCWICDGWHQQTFEWVPGISGQGDQPPIYLHLGFEKFRSIYLPKDKDGQFILQMMVPPEQNDFFFTVNELQVHAAQYNSRELLDSFIKVEQYCSIFKGVIVANRKIDCQIERMNNIILKGKFKVVDDSGNVVVDVLPRTEDAQFLIEKKEVKHIWSFPISIWAKDFRFETEEMLRKCFERDWECCKVTKFIKNSEECLQVKELLWSHYSKIKETYRHYSSMNPSGDIWSISSNPITDFVNSADLIDGKTLKLSDVDLKFIATCSASNEWKGNPRNPERSLVRFQLMEFLVRLGEDKYLKNKLVGNYLEATKNILDQCSGAMMYNAQKWRDERYFNESCDTVLKYYKPILDHIYARYSVKKVKPGHKKFMCLDELHDLCQKANFLDENFVDRDINLAFNLSQSLQVDELENDRLFQMSQVEFYEALGRMADKLSLPKYSTSPDNLPSHEEAQKQHLSLKLEAAIIQLFRYCSDQEFRDDYVLQSKSLLTET